MTMEAPLAVGCRSFGILSWGEQLEECAGSQAVSALLTFNGSVS